MTFWVTQWEQTDVKKSELGDEIDTLERRLIAYADTRPGPRGEKGETKAQEDRKESRA